MFIYFLYVITVSIMRGILVGRSFSSWLYSRLSNDWFSLLWQIFCLLLLILQAELGVTLWGQM